MPVELFFILANIYRKKVMFLNTKRYNINNLHYSFSFGKRFCDKCLKKKIMSALTVAMTTFHGHITYSLFIHGVDEF